MDIRQSIKEKYKHLRKKKEKKVVMAYRGPTLRREVTRGDIYRRIEQELLKEGKKLLNINWKKKTAHYLDEKGRKKSNGFNYITKKNHE